jgi:hypothetical protein
MWKHGLRGPSEEGRTDGHGLRSMYNGHADYLSNRPWAGLPNLTGPAGGFLRAHLVNSNGILEVYV